MEEPHEPMAFGPQPRRPRWRRRFGIGCGAVIALIVAAAILGALFPPSSSSSSSSGTKTESDTQLMTVYAGEYMTATAAAGSGSGASSSGMHTLRYYIDRGTDSITYDTPAGIEQQTNYGGPWDKVLSVPDGFFADISAQLPADASGDIHCEIQVDGVTVQQATANGPASIVECSATVGQ